MKITVNDGLMVINETKVYGAHIRDVCDIPLHHLIIRENRERPDDIIHDDTPVNDGEIFVTHPATRF